MNVEPRPSWLATRTSPPCARTMCLTIASPRPVPPCVPRASAVDTIEALEHARKSAAGIPIPESSTSTAISFGETRIARADPPAPGV